jgi:hypothetical protein
MVICYDEVMKPKLQKELTSIALALNLFRLGSSMVGVFVPLVILRAGGQLWMIALFYLLYAFMKLCINYSAMRFILKKGAHLGLGLGFLFGAIQLFLILGYSISGEIILLVLSAFSLAVMNAFIWNAQHSFISKVMNSNTKSSSIAMIEIIGKSLGIVGPVIGGSIGLLFGSSLLLIVASLIILSTLIPLRYMGKMNITNDQDSIKYNLSGAPVRDLIANFCFNVETTISIMFWPIYLAVVLKTFESIGAIAAVAAFAAIVTAWVAGHRGDKGHDRSVLRQGVAVVGVINIVRIFAYTPLTIGIVSSVYQAALAYLQNSWVSTYYTHAKNKGSQYIISMEIACDLAYVAVWGVLLAVILVSANSNVFFVVAFIIAAVAAWGCLLISRQNKNSEFVGS